jgi:hypothetical protein
LVCWNQAAAAAGRRTSKGSAKASRAAGLDLDLHRAGLQRGDGHAHRGQGVPAHGPGRERLQAMERAGGAHAQVGRGDQHGGIDRVATQARRYRRRRTQIQPN